MNLGGPGLLHRHDGVVRGGDFERLLHEHARDDQDHGEADDELMHQREDDEPLVDVLGQDPTGWSPVRQRDLEHSEHGPREGAVVLVDLVPRRLILGRIHDEGIEHLVENEREHHLDDEEQHGGPRQCRAAALQGGHHEVQGVETAYRLDQPQEAREAHQAAHAEHERVQREARCVKPAHDPGDHDDEVEVAPDVPEEVASQRDNLQHELHGEDHAEGPLASLEDRRSPRHDLARRSRRRPVANSVARVEALVLALGCHGERAQHDEGDEEDLERGARDDLEQAAVPQLPDPLQRGVDGPDRGLGGRRFLGGCPRGRPRLLGGVAPHRLRGARVAGPCVLSLVAPDQRAVPQALLCHHVPELLDHVLGLVHALDHHVQVDAPGVTF
mmetsp:Transcript_2631/g.7429  ORF Transcript_2631/g.7429 Transcript_2631/m.7429 type:complete len:386 (+) Transcript_2631:384-1541(+)